MLELDYLFTTAYAPFTISVLIMLGICVVEMVGLGLSGIDLDFDVDGDTGILDWLGIGKVPLLIILVVLLGLFGLSGIVIQNTAHAILGTLPLWLAVPGALGVTLPLLGISCRGLAVIMPQDETVAVDRRSLLRRRAVILTGQASADLPARGRVFDEFGNPHYVLILPHNPEEVFPEGEEVMLVRKEGETFYAIGESSILKPY